MTEMQWRRGGAAGQVWGWPVEARTDGVVKPGVGQAVSGTDVLDVETPGLFTTAAHAQAPGLVAWAGRTVAARLDHLLDGHRVFLPYLMAGHFPPSSGDASPSVKLTALPLLCSPFTGRVCVAVRVLDPWREFGVWVDPAHLAHRDCAVCTPVWARRAGEFDTAQAEMEAAVAAGRDEYVPILFAQADVYGDYVDMEGDGTGLGWGRPRVIVHAHEVPGGGGGQDGRGVGDGDV